METMLEAIQRLRAEGYAVDFVAVPGGRLTCSGCGESVAASTVTEEETARFEGDSNPEDEAILFAISSPCGHRGLYSSAYGGDVSSNETEVLRALGR